MSSRSFHLLASIALLGCGSNTPVANRSVPPLVPAPNAAAQAKIVAAIEAHPNPPLKIDEMLPLGADSSGLGTVFAAMGKPQIVDGVTRYRTVIDRAGGNATALIVDVDGIPPRVTRRWIETRLDIDAF